MTNATPDNTPEPGDNPAPETLVPERGTAAIVPRPPSTIGGMTAADRIALNAGHVQFSAENVKADVERAKATPEQTDQILWLLAHGRQQKIGGLSKLGDLIERDGATISKLFRGVYPASIEPIVESIRTFRRQWERRLTPEGEPVVETSCFVHVKEFCDVARASAALGLLWGKNQSGKTTALKTYAQRNNHGQTIYVRMPAGGGARLFLNALARACGISDRQNYERTRERLLLFFRPGMLLLVDEAHQAVLAERVKVTTLELIRELWDETRTAVVLCGTDSLPAALKDSKWAEFLGQFDNRGVLRRRIPAAPTEADLALIAEGYGLPPATGEAATLMARIGRENGVGKLTKYLLMARTLAGNKGEAFGWRHVLGTHATLQSWANGEEGR